jgi:hypothetical protein
MGFIRKVYSILSLQLLLTFGMLFVTVFVLAEDICGESNYARDTGGCIKPTTAMTVTTLTSIALSFVFLFTITCSPVCCKVDLARKVPHNCEPSSHDSRADSRFSVESLHLLPTDGRFRFDRYPDTLSLGVRWSSDLARLPALGVHAVLGLHALDGRP